MTDKLNYLNGFNAHFESEAEHGSLPKGRNAPQHVPHGLYAEQLNGTAFTVARHQNLFSWLYRIQPSVTHGEFMPIKQTAFSPPPSDGRFTPPTQMRWNAMPYSSSSCNFIEGIMTFAGNGSIQAQSGAAIHLYAANESMKDTYFYNADGDLLIIPQEGNMRLHTEFGLMDIGPAEIAVIPRGIKFYVTLLNDKVRGYLCENFGAALRLPELGVIGANGLASPRDFQTPMAAYENKQGNFTLLVKFQGCLWSAKINHSPLDVVAWHGRYVPYKYDLRLFNTINTVSFDHPDPSIFTVLTSPTTSPGVANIDFVIFPPRWMVAGDTFRPPYYHRNIMSEYMGLIYGTYDAKQSGFVPGGGSLHNCMSAHGPDAEAFNKAESADLKPEYYDNTLAFMLESSQAWRLTEAAYKADFRQQDYLDCWQGLNARFKRDYQVI